MIGYYLDKVAGTKKCRWQYILLIFSLALGINGGFIYYDGMHSQFSQLYIEMFDYMTAIGIFVLVKKLFVQQVYYKNHPLLCTIISQLGGLTLGMYFFDIVLGFMFYRKLEAYMGLSVAKYSLVWCIFDLTVGAIFTYAYKKIWRRIILKMKEKRLS